MSLPDPMETPMNAVCVATTVEADGKPHAPRYNEVNSATQVE
jgi:hypothetical protein